MGDESFFPFFQFGNPAHVNGGGRNLLAPRLYESRPGNRGLVPDLWLWMFVVLLFGGGEQKHQVTTAGGIENNTTK